MLISSERQQMLDKNLFRSVGIEPADYDIVVVKSQQHFRAAFGPIASAIIEVDADGLSTANLSARDYKKLRRPIYPLNTETTFSA
jgi:microcystin degradation protein MlrC